MAKSISEEEKKFKNQDSKFFESIYSTKFDEIREFKLNQVKAEL